MKETEYASPGDAIFARALKEARNDAGMSQRALADEMAQRNFAFNFSVIGKIERGERRVTVGEAAALADVLGTTIERLLDQHDALSRAYEARDRERRDLSIAASSYVESVLKLAVTADAASSLSERDRDWLDTELEAHTAARVAAEQHLGAEGILHELEIDPGTPYVARLLRRMEADRAALARVASGEEAGDQWVDFADGQPEPSSRKASNG